METRADEIIRRQESLSSERAIFDSHWREIAERILPRGDHFKVNRNPGDKHTERIFDSTAALALDRFSAAMESMLTPRTQRWHNLRTLHDELNDDIEVRAWLDAVTEILFKVRYSPKSNFASQANECYISLGAFGTGAMYIDEDMGRGIRYRAVHLSEIYIAENHQGMIDTVFRRFSLTVRQAAQKFGIDQLSDKMKEILEKSPEQKFEFVHAIQPNTDQVTGRKDYRGMAYYSCYVSIDDRKILQEGGYRTMPYAIGRYVTGPKETYGRSPAMTVLPDIKMINEMSKTVIRAAHLQVEPPLLLQEDGALQAFDMRPGSLNYGGVNDQGQQVVHPLNTGARVDIGMEMMEGRRKMINDAFLVTLFQILVDAPQMTATEAMLRAQEKGALLAPTMGRQQSEFLGPLIERELDILGHAGVLPPMPDKLIQVDGMVDVEYSSPLNKAQRAEEGVAILRTLESVTPLAQIDPSVMMVFDPILIARELSDINGVPAKLLRSPEAIKAMQDQQAQAAQAKQLLEAAPVMTSSMKNMAQAQSLAAASPSQQAPGIFPT